MLFMCTSRNSSTSTAAVRYCCSRVEVLKCFTAATWYRYVVCLYCCCTAVLLTAQHFVLYLLWYKQQKAVTAVVGGLLSRNILSCLLIQPKQKVSPKLHEKSAAVGTFSGVLYLRVWYVWYVRNTARGTYSSSTHLCLCSLVIYSRPGPRPERERIQCCFWKWKKHVV